MTNALKLVITDFCSLENSVDQAESIIDEQIFMDDATKTAYAKVQEYLETLNYKSYLCWNLQVYPRFNVTKIYLW